MAHTPEARARTLHRTVGNAALAAAIHGGRGRPRALARAKRGPLLQRLALTVGRHRWDLGEEPIEKVGDLAERLCRVAGRGDPNTIARLLTGADLAAYRKCEPLANKRLLGALNVLFPPAPVGDSVALAVRLLKERGLSTTLVPLLLPYIKESDVATYNNGEEFQNKQLNKALSAAGLVNLRLRHDHPLLRPWLLDMYTHGTQGNVVIGMGISEAQRRHTELEFGEPHGTTTKGHPNASIGLLSTCFDQIVGRVAVTLVGHIAYGGSANPKAWTLGELSAETIADALGGALREAAPHTTLVQLNLLSCGSEQFAHLLMIELRNRQVHVRLCTAFRDEIPVTPGPLGVENPEYLFAGDLEHYREGRGENISSAVGFVRPVGQMRDLRWFAEQRIFMILRRAFLETIRSPLPREVAQLIAGFALPERPSEAAMNELKRN